MLEFSESELKALWEKAITAMRHCLVEGTMPFTEEDAQALKDIQFHDKYKFEMIFPTQVVSLKELGYWL